MSPRGVPRSLALLLLGAGCQDASPPEAPTPDVSPSRPPLAAPAIPAAAPGDDPSPPAPPGGEGREALPSAPEGPGGPPPDFGAIRPPRPPPPDETRTLHALASYEVVTVYSLPDMSSPRLGYLRIGARAMVTPRIADEGKGCDKGFHALAAGGYVCASKGLVVDPDKAPYLYRPPPPPRLDAPIPYDYGAVVADGTPMWWKIPDDEEITLAAERYRALVAAEEAKAAAVSGDSSKSAAKTTATPAAEAPAPEAPAPLPGVLDEPPPPPAPLTPEEKAEQARREAAARKRAEERKKKELELERARARKRARLPLNSQTPFMEAGFVVTLADKLKEGRHAWWKTTRGGYVMASRVAPKSTNDFHGGEVPEGARAGLGFVEAERGASASTRGPDGALKWKRKLDHRELVAYGEEVEVGGRPYVVSAEGLYVRKGDLRLAVLATRPDGVEPWERWIDVDLERQLLVAYEGDAPVYATLISSGRRGTAEESFATPKGSFRITAKHVSSSMDGNTASDGRYSIQDVPWAMFFSGNYALHGAFWHRKFGERRSHGCINLGPTDARWLFFWTTPFLPEGWHGVSAHEGAPGSMVVIH